MHNLNKYPKILCKYTIKTKKKKNLLPFISLNCYTKEGENATGGGTGLFWF